MKPVPVRQFQSPAYPTRRGFIAGATAFTAAAFAGGWRVFGDEPVPADGGAGAEGLPICILGGVGLATISLEDIAMSIIRDELSKHGIQLQSNVPLKDVLVPQAANKESADHELKRLAKPIPISGMDQSKNIAVEFTTPSNFNEIAGQLGCANRMSNCSYQFLTINVQQQLDGPDADKVYLGVFLDPTNQQKGNVWSILDTEDASSEDPKFIDNLRQQVQVFVGWLKEQNAL
jgi:hypothetical protein